MSAIDYEPIKFILPFEIYEKTLKSKIRKPSIGNFVLIETNPSSAEDVLSILRKKRSPMNNIAIAASIDVRCYKPSPHGYKRQLSVEDLMKAAEIFRSRFSSPSPPGYCECCGQEFDPNRKKSEGK